MKTNLVSSLRRILPALAITATFLALAPARAAADPAAIFVGSYDNTNVPAYDAKGAAATGYNAPGGFQDPEGLAYNGANNTLYVADGSSNAIRTFDATTGAETQIGFAGVTGLNLPFGLTLNAGVLYAANFNNNTVTAYNAATGARVTAGFASPAGLSRPASLAIGGTTLFVVSNGTGRVGAFNLATGAAVPGFATITGLRNPFGLALYGNALFVANSFSNTVGEYDATTGAVINASFITGLNSPQGLAMLGDRLLVTNSNGTTVGAYGVPAVATPGNVPTSADPSFLSGLGSPAFIAVGNQAPEPGTWAFLGLGAAGLGVVVLRRRARAV